MGQVAYKIPRITDEQIHRLLGELAVEFGSFSVGVQVSDTHIGQVAYPEADNTTLDAVLAQKSELIFHFSANIQGVSLAYYRGGVRGELWDKSPVFDDLGIDLQGVDPNRIKIGARILELFRPVQLPAPSSPISLLESQRALQESTFSRLQQQLEKVFEQTIDLREQLDEQVRNKEAVLEDEFKQKALDASQTIQKQTEELEKRERELDERRQSLDESDNTFARRQIRERMLSDVSARVQNFGLSPTTVDARKPVALGMVVLGFFFALLLLMTSYELYRLRQIAENASPVLVANIGAAATSSSSTNLQVAASNQSSPTNKETNGTERMLLWIRFSLLSVGLAATILYYIRWQNQWASTFASTEQSLQQFYIDVNRANWVVETCLEWRKETDSVIPAPLLESLTRGLFTGRETQPAVLHPADELASALMGSASKLSLDLGGNKLEIDKPGKIRKTVKAGPTAVTTEAA